MISLFIGLLIMYTNYQNAEGLINPAPVVYGEIGQNVAIHSRFNGLSRSYTHISWYLLRSSGKVEHLAYFSTFSNKFGRFSGKLPSDSENAYLNISGATIGDSGHLFAVVGSARQLTPGICTDLAITDPKVLPEMRVFLSRSGTVLCELKGGGPHWSDPHWEIYDGEEELISFQTEAETFIDESGAFIRSSILSWEDGLRGLNCICQHNSGVIIRMRIKLDIAALGKDQCQLLLYLSPLAAVLLLVTLTASGLWAWRRGKQRPVTQQCRGMNSNARS